MSVMRPRSIYVIGDSQALVYGDRVWFEARHDCHVARSVYCGLYAGALADELGRFDEAFATAMRGVRLLTLVDGELEASHRTPDPHVFSLAQADGRPVVDPPLVFTAGQLDLQRVARYLPYDDVALPDDVGARFEVAPECASTDDDAVPAADLLAVVEVQLAGFRRGLRRLRELGFGRVAVVSVPPPGGDDALFQTVRTTIGLPQNSRRYGRRFRYKLVLTLNYALVRLCDEEGIDFIDRWAEQTRGGVVRPGVLTDGIHLSAEAADQTMRWLGLWVEQGAPVGARRAASAEREPVRT
jgi:hypothetical protein